MKRQSKNLASFLEQRLNAYALAASAGVGLLVSAQPAEGKIVYTKAHDRFRYSSMLLDLNHDGVIDFGIPIHTTLTDSQHLSSLYVNVYRSQSRNGVVATSSRKALALRAGARIASARQGRALMIFEKQGQEGTHFYGRWVNGGKGLRDRYLGLKFYIHGKPHYGWARLSVWFRNNEIEGVLTGYAYETIPNKPIIAGKTKGPDVITLQPASLGPLAQGASGLSAWRRTNSVAAGH